ncbi:MAG: hypothetical protein LLG06_13120 [Desulfobacteraceae bacterium]|nr:hypothetical protein [Desulfobacteraceae bacterium]
MKVVLALAAMLLCAATLCTAQEINWTYENPAGFDMKEPGYRLPTQIKQALMDNVRGVGLYEAGYEEVYQDPQTLKTWLLSVLATRKKGCEKIQELANLTAMRLNETAREELTSGTHEGLEKAGDCFRQAGDTISRALQAQDRSESVDRQIAVVQAWEPQKAGS